MNTHEQSAAPTVYSGSELTVTAMAEYGRIIIEDAAGARFVVVTEARLEALETRAAAISSGALTRAPVVACLTAREQEVLQLIAHGHSGAMAAEQLGLSANTVAQHLHAVRRKYAVKSTAAAVALARESELIR